MYRKNLQRIRSKFRCLNDPDLMVVTIWKLKSFCWVISRNNAKNWRNSYTEWHIDTSKRCLFVSHAGLVFASINFNIMYSYNVLCEMLYFFFQPTQFVIKTCATSFCCYYYRWRKVFASLNLIPNRYKKLIILCHVLVMCSLIYQTLR